MNACNNEGMVACDVKQRRRDWRRLVGGALVGRHVDSREKRMHFERGRSLRVKPWPIESKGRDTLDQVDLHVVTFAVNCQHINASDGLPAISKMNLCSLLLLYYRKAPSIQFNENEMLRVSVIRLHVSGRIWPFRNFFFSAKIMVLQKLRVEHRNL